MRVLRKFVFHRPTPLIAEAGRTPKIFTFYPRLYYVSGRQYGRILPMTERTDTKLTHPRPTEPRPKARTYGAAAGGFGALTSVWKEAWRHTGFTGGKRAIQTESKQWVDCSSCAWPDPEQDERTPFEFCENGAKATLWDNTRKTVSPAFLTANSVTQLRQQSDYELEAMDVSWIH